MTVWYLDTSAALKLILAEAESAALIEALDQAKPELASSYLLETEVRRAAHRSPDFGQAEATSLLDRVVLHEAPPAVFAQAGLLTGATLRSLDAIHLATAINIEASQIVSYDRRLASAARELGLAAAAPGQAPSQAPPGQTR
ncbi:MAG: type II toxin-antitoxin system VapC family toxin [Bifidobacteriaceae bacterium]|jgi:predicted nucleic acid-binding protein|nr:type II toxin-antitoxin system VapC family toxin [Bifidobacteriaceae bacterium]